MPKLTDAQIIQRLTEQMEILGIDRAFIYALKSPDVEQITLRKSANPNFRGRLRDLYYTLRNRGLVDPFASAEGAEETALHYFEKLLGEDE